MTEVDNSYWLEIEGLQRCLAVEDHGVQISTVATDRLGGIGKLMREHYGHIDHEYDLWHVAKGMKKKLSKKGNKPQGSHAVLKSLKVLEKGSNNFKTLKTMEIYCWVLKSLKF